MGFKLLELIFTFGKLLALTPSSIEAEEESFAQKLYIIFFFVSFTMAKTYSIYISNILHRDNYIHSIIECAQRLAVYSFNLYTMIVVNFWKRGEWNYLLTNLKITNQTVLMNKNKKKIPYYFEFMLVMTSYVLLGSYACYESYHKGSKWEFLRTFADTHMQSFICFFYNFIMFTIARMLLERYKQLNTLLLDHHDFPLRSMSHNHIMESLEKIAKTVGLLRKTVDTFNHLFGWSIALLIFWTTSVVLYYILILMYKSDTQSPSFYIYIFIAMIWTVVLLFLYNSVAEEAKEISYNVTKIQWKISNLTQKEKDEFFELVAYIRENLPEFSAAGFFSVQKSTLLSIAATTINFLIVSIQLMDTKK